MNDNIKDNQTSFLKLSMQRNRQQRIDELFAKANGVEDVAKRQENVKHFRVGTNRHQAVVYPGPVHYRDSDQEPWQDIDNTLETIVNEQGRPVLRNRSNRVHVEFPQQMDGGSMATITNNGRSFSWRFEEEAMQVHARPRTGNELKRERLVKRAQEMPKYVGRTYESLWNADLSAEIETEQERRADIAELRAENRYDEILPGVSVMYTLNGELVKEDIILANATALKHAALRMPKGFTYEVTAGQEVLVWDKQTGVQVIKMEKPVVYDSATNSTIAQVKLTDCGDYVRLEYLLDNAFLENAVFPVTIDPVMNSSNALQNVLDTTLGVGQSDKPHTGNNLKVGLYNNSIACVSLLKFDQIAIPSASDTIVNATLNMRVKSCSTSKYIAVHEVLKSWDVENATWANFDPDNTANIAADAFDCVQGKSSGTLAFDLTTLYRKWCMEGNNHGIAFRSPTTITGSNYSELHSANASTSSYRPVMYVNYVSHAGLEGWWQYEQMSAGRAGTVYADLFNGNMVLAHSDVAMSGNLNPINITHYYNSCLSDANDYHCGYGWKTNMHQKITGRSHNGRNYFVWEDGDGTEHFFEETGSQPYKDAEGMGLELTYNSSSGYFILTDKMDNQIRFDEVKTALSRMTRSRDANQNEILYAYVSGYEEEGRIDTITETDKTTGEAKRVVKFNYSSNRLANIRIPNSEDGDYRYVYFTYDSSSRLTGVRYSDLGGTAAHTTYAYDGTTKLLKKATNHDGVAVTIGYEAASLYDSSVSRRVTSLETTGASSMIGAKEQFEYGSMYTAVTILNNSAASAEDKKLYYQFNDSGNVVCVRDDLGFASFTKYDSGIENKPSETSKLRKVIVNRLRRPDFGGVWESVAVGGSVSVNTENLCLNAPSIKINKTGAGEVKYRQQITLEKGQEFTFSAYVKTVDLADDGAFLRIAPVTADAFTTVISEVVSGTTAEAVGNELPTDGWDRVRVTMAPLSGSGTVDVYAELVCNATAGTAYFACPQVEMGPVANAVNFVSNGDFRHFNSDATPVDWTAGPNTLSTGTTGVVERNSTNMPAMLEGNLLQVEGRPNKDKVGFNQTINMNGKAGDVFVIGGWVNSRSIPIGSEDMRLSVLMRVKSSGTWKSYSSFHYSEEWSGWQCASFAAIASHDYEAIEFTVSCVKNCNTSAFTNMFLHREPYGASYGYDENENVVAVSTLAGQKSDVKYDAADNITEYTQPGRDSTVSDNQYWFNYGTTTAEKKKHLLKRSRTPMHVNEFYDHDTYGNQINARRNDYRVYTEDETDDTYAFIRTESEYSPKGDYLVKIKDERGNEVTRVVDTVDGTLTSVTDPTGQTVNYTYDASKRVTQVSTTAGGNTYKNTYTYNGDRLTQVKHNTSASAADDITYTFEYDGLGRKTAVKVGTEVLSTNTYSDDRRGLLTKVEYGNGGVVNYAYDDFDRLTGVGYTENNAADYEYAYGANGQVAKVKDNLLAREAYTDFDLADRPCQTELRDAATGERLYRTVLKYDKLNNLAEFSEQVGGDAHRTEFTYDRDNRITEIGYDGDVHKVRYTYDRLGRIESRVAECGVDAGKNTVTYGYVPSTAYTTKGTGTTNLIQSIVQSGINFVYEYDSRGNIISETRNGVATTYEYDALGQLIRVNDPHENATWVYTYDCGGNILSKNRYAYTTGAVGTAEETIPYTYGDANWKDKLTNFNGNNISYDAIGNPLSDGIWTYTWEKGRQLKKIEREDTSVTFKYNHNGMRTQKVVQQDWYPVTTNYTWYGKLLTHMTVDYHDWDEVAQQDVLHFYYDAQKRPAKVKFNGAIYTYIHNLQGDIVGILDSAGALVVEYKYDAWGTILSKTGSMASTLGHRNPFRYRGYIYDEETWMYWLKSRYYYPELHRFISVDTLLTGGLLSANQYAYCVNSPICKFDPDGKSWLNAALHAANTFFRKHFDTARIGAFLLNMKKDKNGVYHADFDCWQQHFGYNDLYDWAFNLGTNMKRKKYEFTSNGNEYVLWMWKGDYLNLGAGAEIGIYTGGGPHWKVDKTLALNMSMSVEMGGKNIISWKEKTWWLTGFNPEYQNANISDMTVTFTVSFDSVQMYKDFKASTNDWEFNDHDQTASISF